MNTNKPETNKVAQSKPAAPTIQKKRTTKNQSEETLRVALIPWRNA